MSTQISSAALPEWRAWQKHVFRIGAVFLLLLALPLDWKFWSALFSGEWGRFQTLFQLTAYTPHFIPASSLPKWGLLSYANWGIALILAVIGGLAWGHFDRNRKEYRQAYYWLRVLVRYRLALGIIGYGMLMLFPLQFPRPTLSELHTDYGDFLLWKAYYLTNGIAVAYFQEILGLLEVIGGLLLFGRRTTIVGAGLIAAILLNVVLANFAYELGDHVYSSYLLLLAAVLLAHDTPRLYRLLVREKPAQADHFQPVFAHPGIRRARKILKGSAAAFVLAYGVAAYASYSHSRWLFPETPGLPGVAGYYNVREFQINGRTLPYSLVDPVRWQNVVFEEWNTLSIRIHRPVDIAPLNPPIAHRPSEERDYELAGNGGRHFYRYIADTEHGKLRLEGKNRPEEIYDFDFRRIGEDSLLLIGRNESGDELRVLLDRIDKRYLLQEGRRKPISIY